MYDRDEWRERELSKSMLAVWLDDDYLNITCPGVKNPLPILVEERRELETNPRIRPVVDVINSGSGLSWSSWTLIAETRNKNPIIFLHTFLFLPSVTLWVTCIHTRVCVCVCEAMDACAYIYIYIYIRTHTHIYVTRWVRFGLGI